VCGVCVWCVWCVCVVCVVCMLCGRVTIVNPHPGTAMGYTKLDEGCDPGAPEGVLLCGGGLPGCVTHRVTSLNVKSM